MDHGIAKVDALIDAGRKRAQPIVMTTVAMVAGMVTTALSLSGDGAWRAPMGVVVIGGLILSTLLTLLLVRSEEHTSELQSLLRMSYAVFCLKKKNTNHPHTQEQTKNKQH